MSLSGDKNLTSNNAVRFGSIFIPPFPQDSGGILEYTSVQTI